MNRKILKTVATMDDLDIKELKNLNLGLEIQDFTESNLSIEEKKKIVDFYKKEFEDFHGIKALHGPFLDLKPASPDKDIKEVSYRKYLNTLEIADELKMDYVIFHSQINTYLNEPWMIELNNKQHRDTWLDLLEQVPNFKGTILLENIFEEEPSMLKELIETIDLPNIKINLDIGHAKLGKVSLEEWIKELKDHIEYIHVHSNNGLHDQHKQATKEEIDNLYRLLDKYNISPVLSLEYKIHDLQEEIKKYRGGK